MVRVVVVSDDRDAAEWLESVLLSSGLSVVVLPTADPGSPELGISQLLIADRSSAEAIGAHGPKRRLLLVPRGQAVDMTTAVSGGFMDLLVVPSSEDDILARVGRALDQFLKPATSGDGAEAHIAELTEVVDRAVSALRAAGRARRAEAHRLTEGLLSVFSLLIDAHETGSRGTPGHSRRTGSIVREMASNMDLPPDEVEWLELAGRMHDIGMVVLDLPLADESPLSLELKRALVHHPEISAKILAALGPWGLPVEAIRTHHERPDGSGYPKGLKGEDVSLAAQILGTADMFEALTSSRPWRPAESRSSAIEAIGRMGFDPRVVEAVSAVKAMSGRSGERLKLPGEQR